MSLLNLKNMKFRYRESLPNVLDIKSFTLAKGEKVFLYGPSGCGKTTFLEILAGVLSPQHGAFRFLEEDVVAMTPSKRDRLRAANIGYIFQSFNLIPYLSVQENIVLPLYLSPQRRQKVLPQEEDQILKKTCEQLGILNLLDKTVVQLSVGQQQRVAVARALMGSPELILADEPTSALDQDHRQMFIKLLFEVCQKNQTTLLFVSHDRTLQPLFERAISLPSINQAGQL